MCLRIYVCIYLCGFVCKGEIYPPPLPIHPPSTPSPSYAVPVCRLQEEEHMPLFATCSGVCAFSRREKSGGCVHVFLRGRGGMDLGIGGLCFGWGVGGCDGDRGGKVYRIWMKKINDWDFFF